MNKDFPGGPVVKNLPAIQRTWIQSLAWEHPTRHRGAGPICNNYEPACPRAHAPQQEKPPQWEVWAPQPESSPHSLQLEKALKRQ